MFEVARCYSYRVLVFITVTDYDANNAQNDEKCAANSNGNETKQQSDDTDYVQNRAGSLIGFAEYTGTT